MPVWGTTSITDWERPSLGFQSTCPCGARHLFTIINHIDTSFNPRARVGHDPIKLFKRPCEVFQSTCPCGARLKLFRHFQAVVVSIHVPVWGTTRCINNSFSDFCFNPRARVGHDMVFSSVAAILFVSIHVPVWGTTFFSLTSIPVLLVSIHVPVWGTTGVWGATPCSDGFNPRARVGHDLV